jgi:hypothetical protein
MIEARNLALGHSEWDSDYAGNESMTLDEARAELNRMQCEEDWAGWELRIHRAGQDGSYHGGIVEGSYLKVPASEMVFNFYGRSKNGKQVNMSEAESYETFDLANARAIDLLELWGCDHVYYGESGMSTDWSTVYRDIHLVDRQTKHDMNGIEEGSRIIVADSETEEIGTVALADDETGTVTVDWDNGRRSDVDVDLLMLFDEEAKK